VTFDEFARLVRSVVMVMGALLLLAHSAAAQVLEPPNAVDTYERARADQNVEGALSLFADDATVHLDSPTTKTYVGQDQIRYFLQTNILEGLPELTSERSLVGNRLTWSERAHDALAGPIDLTVEAVVDRGHIVSLVYRPGRLSGAAESPSEGFELSSASLALAGVALLGIGLMSLSTVRSRPGSGSAMQGRLLAALSTWRDAPSRDLTLS
jgi:hypothetical protein